MTRALHDQRRATRKRAKGRSRVALARLGPRYGRAAYLAVAVAAGVAGATTHESVLQNMALRAPATFAIDRLEVVGLATIPDAVLRERIGLRAGSERAAVNPAAIAARLIAHPRIAAAQVSTAFPGTLVVAGEERVPVARVRARGERSRAWWVDSTGMAFESRTGDFADEAELPLLVATENPAVGERNAALASALGALQHFSRAGVSVAEWHLEGRDTAGRGVSPVVHLHGGTAPLVLGNGDRAVQVQSLARALALEQIREAGAIDLRFREQVIFWPAASDVAAAGKRAPPGG